MLLGNERRRRRVEADELGAHRARQHVRDVADEAESFRPLVDAPEEQAKLYERPDLVERELELRHHTEVATTTAKRPMKIRVLLGGCGDDPAVGRDDAGREQVVAAQAGAAAEPPDTASERQSRHARVADDATGDRETVCLCRGVELGPRRATRAAGSPRAAVDRHGAHRAEIDHQPVFADTVTGEAVATPAHRDLHALLACVRERRRDVLCGGALRDRRRAAVDIAVPQRTGGVVAVVAGCEHRASEARAERLQSIPRPSCHVSPPDLSPYRSASFAGASPGSGARGRPRLLASMARPQPLPYRRRATASALRVSPVC